MPDVRIAEPPRAIAITHGRPAVLGTKHMVSSSHYLASIAGLRMYPRGGNAVDAGVAAGIALNVVEPHLTSFGGVAPIMVQGPGMAEPETIDGLGRWPRSLDLATYRSIHGDDMPLGMPRVVTPGAPDAWLTALARYGRLSLADVLAPAIELCDGFPVFPRLAQALTLWEERIRAWPSTTAVFLPGGRPPREGEVLVQRDLGELFRRLIAVERAHDTRGRAAAIMAARDAFYLGDIAREIAHFCEAEGGALTMEDLATYRVSIGPGVRTSYRGVEVYACGPWSQGPLVPMTLNILERWDVASMGPCSLEFLHRYTEAMKLACADREGFFGDPDLVDVPIRGLLDKEYAATRAALVREDRAWPEMPPAGDPWSVEGRTGPAGYRPAAREGAAFPDTSYACAMDAEGWAFSATPSDPAAHAPLVPGIGIIVSSRGAQLWTTPGHPSAIAPGKRPRLTPNPAMLVKDGRPYMPFGCPGEDAQCQAMVQVVCGVVDFGMDTQQAIEMPRVISHSFPWSFHPHRYAPGELRVEGRIPEAVRDGLRALGHRVVDWPDWTPGAAGVCAIRRLDTGTLEGGADPRRESYAVSW